MFRFNKKQTEQVATLLGNISIVFFATIVAPVFTGVQFDTFHWVMLFLGGILFAISAIVSILLLKHYDY